MTLPREVNDALGDYSYAWSDGDENIIEAFRAALVAAIERAIDAKPATATEFVTRAMYNDMVKSVDAACATEKMLRQRAEAAEAERDRLKNLYDSLLTSWEECKEQRDRLAAALATAQARVETMRGAIHAMLDEMETDPVGLGMLRATNAARAALSPATGTGDLPATQKGTGATCLDTGTSGPSGLHPAPAPSDYEAVCGSTGRPQP